MLIRWSIWSNYLFTCSQRDLQKVWVTPTVILRNISKAHPGEREVRSQVQMAHFFSREASYKGPSKKMWTWSAETDPHSLQQERWNTHRYTLCSDLTAGDCGCQESSWVKLHWVSWEKDVATMRREEDGEKSMGETLQMWAGLLLAELSHAGDGNGRPYNNVHQ